MRGCDSSCESVFSRSDLGHPNCNLQLMKFFILLLALSANLWADEGLLKIVRSDTVVSEKGRTTVTFKIQNVSNKAIQLGYEQGSAEKLYTNIRSVDDGSGDFESFFPSLTSLLAKPCHGPQEFQPVAPNETVVVRLELDERLEQSDAGSCSSEGGWRSGGRNFRSPLAIRTVEFMMRIRMF